MNKILPSFGLTGNQMRILFSLEYLMASRDAESDVNFADKIANKLNIFADSISLKKPWVILFRKNINKFIQETIKGEGPNNGIITDPIAICNLITKENEIAQNSTWKYLVLLECSLFSPYYPMSEKDVKEKRFKGLTMDKNIRKDVLKMISLWLDIDYKFVEKVQKEYENSVKDFTGYWNKVFIGMGAAIVAVLLVVVTAGGSIASLFAASGLYGAAAINSGLAALGGGAIAAGGFGMAGGMAVLVGGGVLLAAGTGVGLGMAFASVNPQGVMQESAKLYVVLREIILGVNHDTQRAQEIINSILAEISKLKAEVLRLKGELEIQEEKIKNLEESVSYLEKLLTRIQKFLKDRKNK
ncbi:MAG: hypothetical protein HDS17_05845 [Bacteroides sp.]|nr:hypothetical protein [Bacteroides sp.]